MLSGVCYCRECVAVTTSSGGAAASVPVETGVSLDPVVVPFNFLLMRRSDLTSCRRAGEIILLPVHSLIVGGVEIKRIEPHPPDWPPALFCVRYLKLQYLSINPL